MRMRKCQRRDGALAAELAVMLPFLCFFIIVTVDFARAFSSYLTITNCALNGAKYASADPAHVADLAKITQYAQADASNLSPPPAVTATAVTDALGHPCVDVTVSHGFQVMAGSFPGVPSVVNMQRTVRMRVVQVDPD